MSQTINIGNLPQVQAILTLYKTTDSLPIPKAENVFWPCKKGCANCCKESPPLIHPIEWLLIVSFLSNQDEQFQDKIIDRLYENYSEMINNWPKKFHGTDIWSRKNRRERMRYVKKLNNTPCVFLSDSNECDIYQVRPYKCRTYGTTSKNDRLTGCKDLLEKAALRKGQEIMIHDTDMLDIYFENLCYGMWNQEPLFMWIYLFSSHGVFNPSPSYLQDIIQALEEDKIAFANRIHNLYAHTKATLFNA